MSAPTLPYAYIIFGDLVLPDPVELLTSGKFLRLQELRPLMNAQYRHLATALDLDAAFKEFQERENRLRDEDPRLMVKPSGSLFAAVAVHLLKTKVIYNGKVADTSNPCTKMVVVSGFTPDEAVWWDSHPWREANKFKLSTGYSNKILESHKALEASLRRNSHAKIEIVSGNPNQTETLSLYENENRIDELELLAEQETTIHTLFSSPKRR